MNATVTTVRGPQDRSDYRKKRTSFRAYTDGTARKVADEVYLTKHNIRALDFVCKSWGRVGGFATRMEADAIKRVLEAQFPGTQVEVEFSRTAGCSCGCSPGFVGTLLNASYGHPLSRADVWLTDVLEEGDAAQIEAYAAKQALGLPKEIEEGNAKVAAEKAQQAQEQEKKEQARQARLAEYARYEQEREEQRKQESFDCAAL